jgi:diguanylate cyclase
VADAYEAMTSERPYRNALEPDEAAAELRRSAGHQFDGQIVEALLRAVR